MRSLTNILTLALSTATLISAAPTTKVDLSPLHFPANNLTASIDIATCPPGNNNCGVVTFKSGQYTSFGQGVCIQLGSNVQSIYVAKCYCSLWNSCTGDSSKDAYLGGMMMCEKPKTMDEFDKEVKYISCGGMN